MDNLAKLASMAVFLGFGFDLPGNFVADCKLGDLASLAFDFDSAEFLLPGNFVGCGFVFRDFDNVGDRRDRALWNVFYRAGTAPRAAHSHLL